MKNNTIQNKNVQINQQELLIIEKLNSVILKQSNDFVKDTLTSKNNKQLTEKLNSFLHYIINPIQYKNQDIINNRYLQKFNNTKWLNYFLFHNPVNLLFSIDQFLFEFTKKQTQRKKSSEFQQQLKERKKLSLFYGHLSKKQLKNLLSKSQSYKGYFYKNFFSLLERRLDVILFRSGLVKNIIMSRQLISHKKILVNNKIVNIASYLVNPGDIISIQINKQNEIAKTLLSSIKKRRLHFTISQNFLFKLQDIKNFKNSKKKKTLKNYIRLLLTKIHARTHLKFSNIKNNHFFTFLKYKPLISKEAQSFLLICLQKNYLSIEKKPLFQNRFLRYLNLMDTSNFYGIGSNFFSERSFFSKEKKITSKDNKIKKEKKNLAVLKDFKRNLTNSAISFLEKKSQKNFTIFNQKKILAIYRNIIYKILLQIYSDFSIFLQYQLEKNKQKKIINTLTTLKLKKHIVKKRYPQRIVKDLRLSIIRPLHIEVSYTMSTLILLYSPQRLNFPFYIDIDLILRSFR